MVAVFFPPRMLLRLAQVKKEITKATLARTQQTSAKKKAAKKATKKPKKAKKPKKKKAKKKKKKKKAKKKKKKKKKKKVVKYPGGKRAKGQHKSKASKASRAFLCSQLVAAELGTLCNTVSSAGEGGIQLQCKWAYPRLGQSKIDSKNRFSSLIEHCAGGR